MKKICLVIGAGAGIGGNTAHRFASEGYRPREQKGQEELEQAREQEEDQRATEHNEYSETQLK